jgi:hypothetical protein
MLASLLASALVASALIVAALVGLVLLEALAALEEVALEDLGVAIILNKYKYKKLLVFNYELNNELDIITFCNNYVYSRF